MRGICVQTNNICSGLTTGTKNRECYGWQVDDTDRARFARREKHYSELQRSLSGISPRLLAARLRMLEQHGMLTRTAHPTVPPTTEYADNAWAWLARCHRSHGQVRRELAPNTMQEGSILKEIACKVATLLKIIVAVFVKKKKIAKIIGKPCVGQLPDSGIARLRLLCELKCSGKRYSYSIWRVVRACLSTNTGDPAY